MQREIYKGLLWVYSLSSVIYEKSLNFNLGRRYNLLLKQQFLAFGMWCLTNQTERLSKE
jgi:putative Ca2+/H+ antiporter (TMEM165/GDT1 family)